MSTSITTIQGTDIISDSRTDINNNFSSLNTNKIETSVLDTDNTLAANSDTKIPSQKAVKTYVDAGGNVNASETTKGIVQEATDAQVTAGTATGTTGAKLFITPAKLATFNASLTAPVIRAYSNIFGSSTTQFDITNPSGSTFRYTYDGTGTDPTISATTVPIGTTLIIAAQNFSAGNNGTFTITGSGSNYFEVTNGGGVAETNKTIGTGSILYGYAKANHTGLKYVVVEVQGGGSGGGTSHANGGDSSFGSFVTAGGGVSNTAGGTSTGGDLNITGMKANKIFYFNGSNSTSIDGSGIPSILGSYGAGGGTTASAGSSTATTGCSGGYGRKVVAVASLGTTETITIGAGGIAGTDGVAGGKGIIILTEFY